MAGGIEMNQPLTIAVLFLAMIAPVLAIELTDWLYDLINEKRMNRL